jgi:Fe-S-cluster containining protein
LRGEALEALSPAQQQRYAAMVGEDGWCIHYDTGGRRCRIYEERPDFCHVENLAALFGAAPGPDDQPLQQDQLAIACCLQQIRAEYGGRGRVMRRFRQAIRRAP